VTIHHRCPVWYLPPLAAVLAAALACGAPATSPPASPTPPLSREAAIPPGAIKWTPADDPHPPILHAAGWRQPVPLGAPVNTAGAEDSPFIMPDGSALYFFFTPDVRVPPERQLLDGVSGLYQALPAAEGWAVPQRLQLAPEGTLALDGCAFVRGDRLWFCSAREGYTGVNLFQARWVDGRWHDWQYAGDQLMKDYQVGEMHLAANGDLYFHSARPGGLGQLDLWVSHPQSGDWSVPENLAAVNSPDSEGWPFVTEDGAELWFTRPYRGAPAIFRAPRAGDTWGAAELVVSQFAGEPTLDGAGNLYFVHHYFQEGVMQEADLYVAYRQ
jgi:hypothetical protein